MNEPDFSNHSIRKRPSLTCPFEKIYPSELKHDDIYFMQHAYNQAIEAWKIDEVPIGAVIALEGQIIAKAHNQVESNKDATAHAEILAITQATRAINDWRLNKATLYVTKEPCPMCSGAMIMARIGRVVYAIPDPKMGLLGGASNISDIPTLNHHPKIDSGIFKEECLQLIQAYFKIKREKNPSAS